MTDKKILELLDGYQSKLQNMLVEGGVRTIEESRFRYEKLIHTLGMIPKMRKFLEEGRREKAFRWLGFLQCVFWMLNIYTVEELANHSRPTKSDIKEQHSEHSLSQECDDDECCNWVGARPAVAVPAQCIHYKEYLEAPENPFPIT